MRPNELSDLLKSMSSAADVIEAIDQPSLQRQRGWDLAEWTYDMVPWGVAFYRTSLRHEDATLVAVALPEQLRNAVVDRYPLNRRRTTVLMLG
jgi:hypothetical protein